MPDHNHDPDIRSFDDLRSTGLLWLINRIIFHPRGYALAFYLDDAGEVVGWSMLGNGTEPWRFPSDRDRANFELVERYFAGDLPTRTVESAATKRDDGEGLGNFVRPRPELVKRDGPPQPSPDLAPPTQHVPIAHGDDIPHELTEDCWCMPKVEVLDGGTVIAHNAINPRFWGGGDHG